MRFQVQSSGFRGYNIPTLIMFQHQTWIRLFHPLGVKALRTLKEAKSPWDVFFWAIQPGTLNVEPLNPISISFDSQAAFLYIQILIQSDISQIVVGFRNSQ